MAKNPPGLPRPRQSNPQPQNNRKKRHYARMLLLMILGLLLFFFVSHEHPDEWQFLGLLIAIIGIEFFDPVFGKIDRFDSYLVRTGERSRQFIGVHLASRTRSFLQKVKPYRHHLVTGLLVIVILFLLFHTTISNAYSTAQDFFCLRTSISIPDAFCNSGLGVITLSDGERIGLIGIDNATDAPFDTSNENSDEVTVDRLILAEDKSACAASQPHITLAVVTFLSRTVDDPTGSVTVGLNNLQGAYLAQHDYNAGHPPVRLCLVIANIGTLLTPKQSSGSYFSSAQDQVIQQLVQYSRYDTTFRGIVGFPYSIQLQDAFSQLSIWQKATIAIVSPSATSNDFSFTPQYPNFHRVSSPDARQGEAMANYVCGQLVKTDQPVSIAIFSDITDSYSSSLSSSFHNSILRCLHNGNIHIELYRRSDAASIPNAIAHAILQEHDQYLFFPGYISDLDILEAQVQSLLLGSSFHVTILGGDGLYDINKPHSTFATIYTTVYGSPLDMRDPQSKAFFEEYKRNFPLPYLSFAISNARLPYDLLPEDVNRAYEATEAFTATLQQLGKDGATVSQTDFDRYLSRVGFNSFGSSITFQGSGINDPNPVPVYIMCIDSTHTIHWSATYDNSIKPVQGSCD